MIPNFNELFEYRKGHLYRKIKVSNVHPGDIVKAPTRDGYLRAMVDGVRYNAHYIVWYLHNGKFPDKGNMIRHINRNRGDNRIENLEEIRSKERCKNQKKSIKNKSGHTGIEFYKSKWKARICGNKHKRHSATFNTIEEAIAWRKKKVIEYGYHKNHGKTLIGEIPGVKGEK
jgi:hypothetical protein